MNEMVSRNIAVFIDLENFREEILDIACIMTKLKERGRLIVKRAYADWGRFGRYKSAMLENSIELIELPFHAKRGKNSTDIKLTVDALEIAMSRNYIDTFVILSGDSDYTPLISKLREYNKYVIVIGTETNTSSLISGYCDELVYYSSIAVSKKLDIKEWQNLYKLLQKSLQALESNSIPPTGSMVKQWMKQFDGSFDEGNYGFTQFKSLLQQAEKEGIVELEMMDKGGDYIVSNPKKKEEVEEDAPIAEKTMDYFKQLLWSAIRLYQLLNPSDNTPTINTISSNMKELEPEFVITEYGYRKKAGLKAMFMDMEKENLIELEYCEEKNEYFLTPTQKFSSLQLDQQLHPFFYHVYYKKLLQKYDVYCNLFKLDMFVQEINSLIKEKKNLSLKELFSEFEGERFASISSAACKKFCYFLIKSRYLIVTSALDEVTQISKELLAESTVKSIWSFDAIVEHYISHCSEKIRSLTGKIHYSAFESLFLKDDASDKLRTQVQAWIARQQK